MSVLLTRCSPAGWSARVDGWEAPPPAFDLRYDSGVIKSLGSLQPLPEEKVIDLAGAHLCPGLVDAHVHLALGGGVWSAASPVSDPVLQNAAAHRACGVTAVRDLGGDDVGSRHGDTRTVRSPVVDLPRIVRSRGAITRRGSYGGFLGVALDPGADLAEAVRGRMAAGAQVVKVILTGSVDFERGVAAPAHFSGAELDLIVATAHAEGVPVAVHANGAEAIGMAVKAGADSIEHGILADEDAVAVMADSDVVWVPTLSPLHALDPDRVGRRLPEVLAAHEAMVARALEAGVRIAAGTDAGSPGVPHGALLGEIAHLRALGFTPAQAREAAGPVGADLLGLESGYGRLQAGARTDLVWFDQDPFVRRTGEVSLPRPLGVLTGI